MAEISIHDLNFCAKNAPKEMITLAEKEYEEKVLRVANRITENENTKLIIYTTSENETATVPSLVGKKIEEAIEEAVEAGLNIRINGCKNGGTVTAQSLPAFALVNRGEFICLTVLSTDFED